MSKIIRNVLSAPAIVIGGQRVDIEAEAKAEAKMRRILPMVEVLTDVRNAKLIPIGEVTKIERVMSEAVAEATRQGHRQGFDEGHRKGLEEGLTKSHEVMRQFEKAIGQAVEQREAMLEEARQRVLDLVIQISRKVTFDAIRINPESTADMIRGVIDSLVDRSRLKIRVHPDHLPIIEQNINQFLKGSTAIKEIAIEADPRVDYGGCFIETPTGDIDARLESQFEVVMEQLHTDEVDQ
ncbi:MAG: FliH/SctL family protein [bacterium]